MEWVWRIHSHELLFPRPWTWDSLTDCSINDFSTHFSFPVLSFPCLGLLIWLFTGSELGGGSFFPSVITVVFGATVKKMTECSKTQVRRLSGKQQAEGKVQAWIFNYLALSGKVGSGRGWCWITASLWETRFQAPVVLSKKPVKVQFHTPQVPIGPTCVSLALSWLRFPQRLDLLWIGHQRGPTSRVSFRRKAAQHPLSEGKPVCPRHRHSYWWNTIYILRQEMHKRQHRIFSVSLCTCFLPDVQMPLHPTVTTASPRWVPWSSSLSLLLMLAIQHFKGVVFFEYGGSLNYKWSYPMWSSIPVPVHITGENYSLKRYMNI